MEQRRAEAMRIVYRYMAMSAGAALIPGAGTDVIVLAGLHVGLIKQLCDHYQVHFSDHAARNILIGVLGSAVPGAVGSIIGRKALALLPWTGAVAGWALMSAGSAAFSYGLGRLFIHHFESGGTLLSFDTRHLHMPFRTPPAAPAVQ